MGRMEAGVQFGKIVLTPHLTVDAQPIDRTLQEPRPAEPSRLDEPAPTSVFGEEEEQQ